MRDFIKLSWKRFFYEKVQVKNLYESQFPQFRDENILYLAFKFAFNKNQSGWLTTFYSVQVHLSFPLFTFLD